jgi:hypothetical protein
LDWLALGQHHGLPTRLLDWTANALAALWFVVREEGDLAKNKAGAVWVLNPADGDFVTPRGNEESDPFNCRTVTVYRPRHVGDRIIAQAGYFTLHPLNLGTERFNVLDHDPNFGGGLIKILVPHTAFSDIRDELARNGVSALTMFPGLDGVCDYLKWNNCLLKDEADHDYKGLNH